MLKYTQLLAFEIGSKCNLCTIHLKCPNSYRQQSEKVLTDDLVVSMALEAYKKYNFRGHIAWHYYNEPMLQFERILDLIRQIRLEIPRSKFLMWSNATINPKTTTDLFDLVICTNYGFNKEQTVEWHNYFKSFSRNAILEGHLDDRLNGMGIESEARCFRPLVDFTIDNFGVAHICCHDWKANVDIGNIWDNSFEEILNKREEVIKQVCGRKMKNPPKHCLTCKMRSSEIEKWFSNGIAIEGLDWANKIGVSGIKHV